MINWDTLLDTGHLPPGAPAMCQQFYRLLLEQNQTVNLTRLTEETEFIVKHLLDSFSLLPFLPADSLSLIDVGTGGGIPGIPLWIARPHWSLTLLDATKKKVRAVATICQELHAQFPDWLPHLPVCLAARAEEAGQAEGLREAFDVAICRAVAPLPILLELCLPLVKPGGLFIAMKGRNFEQESQHADAIARQLGGQLSQEIRYDLPGDIEHALLIFAKTEPTPPRYPRRPGMPAKYPLG